MLMGLALVACALFAATALAATITGDDGDNHLIGTKANDAIDAKGGNDVVHARPGDDQVTSGATTPIRNLRSPEGYPKALPQTGTTRSGNGA